MGRASPQRSEEELLILDHSRNVMYLLAFIFYLLLLLNEADNIKCIVKGRYTFPTRKGDKDVCPCCAGKQNANQRLEKIQSEKDFAVQGAVKMAK